LTAGESTASRPSPGALRAEMQSLWQQLQGIRERAAALESRFAVELQQVHPNFADCVMLNKGPNILGAIRTLDDILRTMQRHQDKKTTRLARLSISDI
jgi:hypothetical protein